ncbi:hypothetical protein FS837_000668 [Tulasnella sp. UAMH 9824]|nr:hypothetical protein FS837_000668 [Tulasnella sp. UAMH 9824]
MAPIHEGDGNVKIRLSVHETYSTSDRDQVDEGTVGNVSPTELASDEEIIVQHTTQTFKRSLPITQEIKASTSDLAIACPTSSRVLQASNVSHSWTTSIVVSIVIAVLGTAIYEVRPYDKATPGPPAILVFMTATPSLIHPVRSMTVSLHPLLIPQSGDCYGFDSHASSDSPTLSLPLLVPLASAAPPPPRRLATSRTSSTTPLSARVVFCDRGSWKDKEKEIVDVRYADAQIQTDSGRPRLPGGLRISLTLGCIIRGVKAVPNDHLPVELEDGKSSSITDRVLSFSAIVTFDELLDEAIVKSASNTSNMLQELSSAASVRAGSLISTAWRHTGRTKVALARHGFPVRYGAKTLARHIIEQHRMARKRFNAVKAKDFQADMKAAKLQGHNTRKGCKAIEYG